MRDRGIYETTFMERAIAQTENYEKVLMRTSS